MTGKYAKILFAVLASSIVGSSVWARKLTMQQAIDMARQHSFELKRRQAIADASGSILSASKAERMPTLSAEALGSIRDEVASLTLEPAPGVIIHRELGSKEVFQTDVRLSLPLYTGGRLSSAIDIAHADQKVQAAMVRASDNEVVLTSQVEYLSLFMADTLLASSRAALDRANIVHKDIQSMYDAGTADSVDLLEARLNVSEAQLGLDEARTRRRQAEIRLDLLIGLEAGESITLAGAIPEPRLGDVKMMPVQSDKAELEAAQFTVARLEKERKQVTSRLLPSLSAFAGYSYGKPNQDMFNKTWNDYFIAGAKLSWSLNLGFSDKKRVDAADARYRSGQMERDRIAEQLDREANLAYEKLSLAYRKYTTALERQRIASDNYRLARQRQKEGTIPTNRLLEIEKSLTQAESALAASLADFYIARASYYYATGSGELERGL
jgi:outer membrane protein TolC